MVDGEAQPGTDPGAGKQTNEPKGTEYRVLRRVDAIEELKGRGKIYQEVTAVVLPPRSHRKGAVPAALVEADVEGEAGMGFLVLDGEQGRELMLQEKPPAEPAQRFEVV